MTRPPSSKFTKHATCNGTSTCRCLAGHLFPETLPAHSPKWPKKDTQLDKVLVRLLTGERLTQPIYGFDDWRLAARIGSLIDLGWSIESGDVSRQREDGTRSTIKEYWLTADTISSVYAC